MISCNSSDAWLSAPSPNHSTGASGHRSGGKPVLAGQRVGTIASPRLVASRCQTGQHNLCQWPRQIGGFEIRAQRSWLTGLFRLAGPPATTSLEAPFNNSGRVELDSGTLSILGGVFTQTGGGLVFNGGNLVNNTALRITGGIVTGNGAISGSVTNGGIVSRGASIGQIFVGGTTHRQPRARCKSMLAGRPRARATTAWSSATPPNSQARSWSNSPTASRSLEAIRCKSSRAPIAAEHSAR